ncbi:MAG: hypothetical protein JXX29_00305 [Deltaproteobacteria bacterium]|nr:hypothetical protein [Deltaproteobacteria bacterium]MBN2670077.1 hypothetical protein [Deltaproteobacteria bacterium]
MEQHADISIIQLIDEFMNEMQQKTGVGNDFLTTIRPAVRKMFQHTEPENLSDAKESFVKKAQIHVQTLAHLSNTLEHLAMLSEREKTTPLLTPAMAKQLAFTKGIVVNTLIKTYGGFGSRVTILG